MTDALANVAPEDAAATAPAGSDRRPPATVCGYPVLAVLASTQADEPDFLGPSYLATGPGGRRSDPAGAVAAASSGATLARASVMRPRAPL
jgi:hypothetical protein